MLRNIPRNPHLLFCVCGCVCVYVRARVRVTVRNSFGRRIEIETVRLRETEVQ